MDEKATSPGQGKGAQRKGHLRGQGADPPRDQGGGRSQTPAQPGALSLQLPIYDLRALTALSDVLWVADLARRWGLHKQNIQPGDPLLLHSPQMVETPTEPRSGCIWNCHSWEEAAGTSLP